MELRSRVIAFVAEGHGPRGEPTQRHWFGTLANARHFRVSPRFMNDMVILKRENGGLLLRAQGNHAEGKLAHLSAWLRGRLVQKGCLTLDEIVVELAAVHGGLGGKWRLRLGLSHKNAARRRNPAARYSSKAWSSGAGHRLKPASRIWPTC